MKTLYNVYIKSAGGMKVILLESISKKAAHTFCEDNNWEWYDENDFCWDLDYEEC